MRVFTKTDDDKLIQYQENDYSDDNLEKDLDNLLQNNPEYFFEGERVLIVGKQVQTNLGKQIDLLGLDDSGNTVVIELKRGKTPRETVAQLLEYASFVDTLDYGQLNDIYQRYSGDEMELESYHNEYYEGASGETVSFNKSSKLVIVAQAITPEIRQTALYLRRKGLDVYCVEFRYFKTPADEEIITSDFVVGEEDGIKGDTKTAQQPKTDRETFFKSLDKNGVLVFNSLFGFMEENDVLISWGTKGFSANVALENVNIQLFCGYPLDSVFSQSIFTNFILIGNKVTNGEEIAKSYREYLLATGLFAETKKGVKWIISGAITDKQIKDYLDVLSDTTQMIKENGLKES